MGSGGSKRNIEEPKKVIRSQPMQPEIKESKPKGSKITSIAVKKQVKFSPIKREIPPIPLSKEAKGVMREMK